MKKEHIALALVGGGVAIAGLYMLSKEKKPLAEYIGGGIPNIQFPSFEFPSFEAPNIDLSGLLEGIKFPDIDIQGAVQSAIDKVTDPIKEAGEGAKEALEEVLKIPKEAKDAVVTVISNTAEGVKSKTPVIGLGMGMVGTGLALGGSLLGGFSLAGAGGYVAGQGLASNMMKNITTKEEAKESWFYKYIFKPLGGDPEYKPFWSSWKLPNFNIPPVPPVFKIKQQANIISPITQTMSIPLFAGASKGGTSPASAISGAVKKVVAPIQESLSSGDFMGGAEQESTFLSSHAGTPSY